MRSVETQIMGESPAFLDLMDQVSRAAPMERPVLVIGERGTGKELIASRLHYLSRRWDRPFIKLNCAALPDTLLESELFGHEAGAFTGATRRRQGRFELANRGTLFLDEIANMSASAQEKLLRVIEYGEFDRIGGSETLKVDVRIIGATNIDLPAQADAGKFRHDLLDRLAFDVLTVPPLSSRPEDILILAEHFAREMAGDLGGTESAGFSADAEAALLAHAWPGNVRELRNVVERAVYRTQDPEAVIEDLTFDPFQSPWRPAQDMSGRPQIGAVGQVDECVEPTEDLQTWPDRSVPIDFRATVFEYETRLLERALQACRFNQRAAARHLGLTYDQLRHACKKHHLLGG